MTKSYSVIYLESPLQLISSSKFISNTDNCFLIYRKTNIQLENLVKNFKNIENVKLIKVENIFIAFIEILNIKFFYKVDSLGLGDIRSFYSMLFMSLLKRNKTVLFDDGGYSKYLDQQNEPLLNASFQSIKSIYIKKFLKNKFLYRETLYKHKIYRKYYSVVRNDLNLSLSNFEINQKNALQNLKVKNQPTFYYIESSLEGWVSDKIESEIYLSLQKFCIERELRLVIIGHRKMSMERIKKLTSLISNYDVIKIDYPIEFYLTYIDKSVNFIGFTITTAIFSALEIISSANILQVKINDNNFYSQYLNYSSNFYNEVEIDIKNSTLKYEEIII